MHLKKETAHYKQIPLEFRQWIVCERNLEEDEHHFLFQFQLLS